MTNDGLSVANLSLGGELDAGQYLLVSEPSRLVNAMSGLQVRSSLTLLLSLASVKCPTSRHHMPTCIQGDDVIPTLSWSSLLLIASIRYTLSKPLTQRICDVMLRIKVTATLDARRVAKHDYETGPAV